MCSFGLQELKKLVTREFTITQDLGEQSRTDGFAAVYRDDCDSSVRMTKEVMASTDSNITESSPLKSLDELFTCQQRKRSM